MKVVHLPEHGSYHNWVLLLECQGGCHVKVVHVQGWDCTMFGYRDVQVRVCTLARTQIPVSRRNQVDFHFIRMIVIRMIVIRMIVISTIATSEMLIGLIVGAPCV